MVLQYDSLAQIGVFDSGIGGKALAVELQKSFPKSEITVVDDAKNVPYGSKTPRQVQALTETAIQSILGNDVIVIACNTATALSIDYLRDKYPNQKFVGIEPMIKPATKLSKSKIIAVCATPATLASERYNNLKSKFSKGYKILEPDCSSWALMIEQNAINKDTIAQTIESAIGQKADVIVLGCTHYHWIKALILELVRGQAQVLEPSSAIAERVAKVLGARGR